MLQIAWWGVNRISAFKRYLLAMQTRNNPGDLIGSAELVDHLFDAFLYGLGAYLLIHNLQDSFSVAAAGLAAFGGVSTLVISLASQGLVSQVFYGLFLAASNKIRKGDVVKFGDGAIAGMVANMGWTDTLVRGSDGIMVSVPNKELGTFRNRSFACLFFDECFFGYLTVFDVSHRQTIFCVPFL